MREYLKEYIYNNFKDITFILFFIIFGLVVGIALFNISDITVKEEIVNNVNQTINISKTESFEGVNIILNGVFMNLILIGMIYFCSITLIPKILIYCITLLKGISLGLYIPILFYLLSPTNALISLLILILIPNVIYLFAYIFICNNSILFHERLFNGNIKFIEVLGELLKVVIAFSIIVVSILVEQVAVVILLNKFI